MSETHNELPPFEIRQRTLQELLQQQDTAPDGIRQALRDSASQLRQQAIREAAATLPPEELLSYVRMHSDAVLRNAGIEALSLAGDRALPLLQQTLSDTDLEVVMFVVQILGDLNSPHKDLSLLLPLLGHDDKNIAQNAIEALAKNKYKAALPRLLEIVESDFWLQLPAIYALGELGEESATAALIPILQDELFRAEAAEALGKIASRDAIQPLVQLWKAETWPPLRSRLTLAIARIVATHPESKQQLATLLDENDFLLLKTLLEARFVVGGNTTPNDASW
jgi:HEAT repeat protein